MHQGSDHEDGGDEDVQASCCRRQVHSKRSRGTRPQVSSFGSWAETSVGRTIAKVIPGFLSELCLGLTACGFAVCRAVLLAGVASLAAAAAGPALAVDVKEMQRRHVTLFEK